MFFSQINDITSHNITEQPLKLFERSNSSSLEQDFSIKLLIFREILITLCKLKPDVKQKYIVCNFSKKKNKYELPRNGKT